MRYRKKPVVIEAIKLGNKLSVDEFSDFMKDQNFDFDEDGVYISTLEGVMRANPGDYIIRGIQGEYYPIKSDIFKETYEPCD